MKDRAGTTLWKPTPVQGNAGIGKRGGGRRMLELSLCRCLTRRSEIIARKPFPRQFICRI